MHPPKYLSDPPGEIHFPISEISLLSLNWKMNFQCLKFNFLISEICFPISENSDYLMLAIVFVFWQNVTTGPLLKVLQWELKEYNLWQAEVP